MSTALAAVLREPGTSPTVESITLPSPGPHQVRVRLAATGICHSDLSLARGTFVQPFPAVLGHEGAGHVVEAGQESGFEPGDAVILNWLPACRECWFCTHAQPYLCVHSGDAAAEPYATLGDGTPVYAGLGVGAFATETVVAAGACVRVPSDVELEDAAVLGCAVLTGVGAVLNTAGVQPGESAVVFGLGGVGLSALQGARIAGAAPIIAVDPSAEKLQLALRLGATDVLQPSADVGKQVRALTGGRGADHAFECVGRSETIRAAWSASRRGGHTTIVGMGARTDTVAFSALELPHFARTLTGSMYGSSDPERDIPMLLQHVRSGRLDLRALVTAHAGLDGITAAFADLESGRGARTVVLFEQSVSP